MMKERRWLLAVTALGAVVRLYVWSTLRGSSLVVQRLPDDALYYFTIARNLVHGHGLSFDSVHPTNGMHPLWLFLISPIFAVGLGDWQEIHAILLLQSLLDVAMIWLIGSTVFLSLRDARESNRLSAGLSAALIYALNIPGLIGWINGLETTIAALMLVVWLRVYLRASSYRSWIACGIVTGLVLLARTDLFIVLLPVALYNFSRQRREWRKLAVAIALAAIVVAPWVLWNVLEFGTPLQSSAEAVPILAMKKYQAIYGSKPKIYAHLLGETARNLLKPFWYSALGVALPLMAFAFATRRKKLEHVERTIYLMILGGLLLLTVHTMFRGFIRDWYVLDLLPLFVIGFGLTMGFNVGKAEVRLSGRALFTLALVIGLWIFYPVKRMTSQLDMVYRGLPVVRDLTSSAKVASFNTGYYSFFASRPGSVVDLDGVVSAEAVSAIKRGDLHSYLDRQNVSYIFDFEGDFGGYHNLIDRQMLDKFERIQRDTSTISSPMLLYKRR